MIGVAELGVRLQFMKIHNLIPAIVLSIALIVSAWILTAGTRYQLAMGGGTWPYMIDKKTGQAWLLGPSGKREITNEP
jgi:hypothetical protein